MIKVKTKIPSGSLTLLTKPNAAGECAVYLRYYLGSYIKKSTDIWVNQKDWDSKRQCVKSSAKNSARINARLYDIKAEIDLQRQLLHPNSLRCLLSPESDSCS